jgi:hypothetical protein
MQTSVSTNQSMRARNLWFFAHPEQWPAWPFLPLVKRSPDKDADYGVLFDAMGTAQLTGYSATVFLTLCGDPHNVSYAHLRIMRIRLEVMLVSLGFGLSRLPRRLRWSA